MALFTHMVLSGGGFSGLALLGVFRFLVVEGLDKSIHHVCGTSMGAFFATAFALGIPVAELEERWVHYFKEPHTLPLQLADLLQAWESYGLDAGHRVVEILREDLGHMTFLELAKRTGKQLVLCATHADTMDPMYFGVDTTPHVLVYDALRASMAVPWLVQPVRIGKELFVDGGVSDNVPVGVFADIPSSSILVVHTQAITKNTVLQPMSSPWAFTWAMFQRFLQQLHHGQRWKDTYPYYVNLEESPCAFMPLQLIEGHVCLCISKEDVDASVAYGFRKAQERLTTS
jgi:NTE family protein